MFSASMFSLVSRYCRCSSAHSVWMVFQLGPLLGRRQRLHLHHQHEQIEDDLPQVQQIVGKQVVVGDLGALEVEDGGQDADQREEQQRVLHGDLPAGKPVHLPLHRQVDEQVDQHKTAHVEQDVGDGALHKIGGQRGFSRASDAVTRKSRSVMYQVMNPEPK